MAPPSNTLSTTIRPGLLRGVPLCATLKGAGKHWLISPVDLRPEERENLWNESKETDKIGIFLSQSWQTPGWKKYLSLLVVFYWRPAAVVYVAATVFFSVLDVLDMVPGFGSISLQYGEEVVPTSLGAWSFMPACLAIAALFVAPEFARWLGGGGPLVFFDAMCINQIDNNAKAEAIYSLGGFLTNSEELLVLWSPEYFGRCWCVFEMATFISLHRSSKIRWCPLFIPCWHFFTHIFITIWSWLHAASVGLKVGFGLRNLVLCLFTMVTTYLWIRLGRVYMNDQRKLFAQMREFTFAQAKCREDSDRELIGSAIDKCFGDASAFERFVQEDLKSEVGNAVSDFGRSPQSIMLVMLSMLSYLCQWTIAYAKSGMSLEGKLSVMMGIVAATLFLPLWQTLIVSVCEEFREPRKRNIANHACDIGLTILLVGCGSFLSALGQYVVVKFRFAGLLIALFQVAVNMFVFGVAPASLGESHQLQ